ncbi:MAG TPA: nucleotidyltransferase domain-containing protein [Anaerolineae bacterium]
MSETISIPADKMAQYRRTAQKRWQAEQEQRQQRRARAWELAQRAATLLKAEFDVERVVLFGSLLYPDRFTLHSDVDLAAWGLTPQNWLKAITAVSLLADDIPLNLVDVATCSPELLAVIEQEGVQL